MKASFESATDAEELSEHLDNLERLIDRLGSIEREAEEEGYHQELTVDSFFSFDFLKRNFSIK